MPSLKTLFLTALTATSLVFAQDTPFTPDNTRDQFRELLEALPAESLHAALHQNLDPKFQDGVYEHEKGAVEALHNEDPPMATRVLAIAALELLKRQNSNATTTVAPVTSSTQTNEAIGTSTVTPTTTPTPTTSAQVTPTSTTTPVVVISTTSPLTTQPQSTTTPAVTSSTSEAVVVPVEISTTNSAGSSVVLTTSAIATPSASVTLAITSTNSAGSTVVSTTTAPAAIIVSGSSTITSAVSRFTNPVSVGNTPIDITTTDAQGATVVLSSVTLGKVITATDARGSTFVTTYTPGANSASVNSLVLITTTLPNGVRSTITSFAVVAPASATGTGQPRLQGSATKGAALPIGALLGVLAAGLAGTMLML